MTPAARVAAAIEVLDDIRSGAVPEKALTGWGRAHRFAGSKDRAAIRDHVFQALRCRASYAWVGGADTGRGIMLGAMRTEGGASDVFTGEGHAPAPVAADEAGAPLDTAPRAVRLDMPDWLLPHFDASLTQDADAVLSLMQERAGVFLRVNQARCTVADAQRALAQDGIVSVPLEHVKTALQAVENERRISQSSAYLDGLVDLQDPSSQAAMLALPVAEGQRVLDFCAGGGGKALALAALGAEVTAHDVDPRRMVDIAPRAARAGITVTTTTTKELQGTAPFQLVLCDAPCSGSGTWRRAPAAKWALTPERLNDLCNLQDEVLRTAAPFVAKGGWLAYATCSVFQVENSERVHGFISEHPEFERLSQSELKPQRQGDGFFLSILQRRAD